MANGSQVQTKTLLATPTLLEAARVIVKGPSFNRTKTAGYDIKPGEKVLLLSKTTDDPAVTEALVTAMREVGASCDVIVLDVPDRPVNALDEYRAMMHNIPGIEPDPNFTRWYQKMRWVEELAVAQQYNLLIQGEAGQLPVLEGGVRYEGAPWFHRVTFPAAGFPWPLWDLINKKAWAPIWEKGRGGRVTLTDPEGTALEWTLFPEHWEAEHYAKTGSRRRFQDEYYLGHLYGIPTPPYEQSDTEGVIAGTINHFGRPFPWCQVSIEAGQVTAVEGGGEYGDKWRSLLEETKQIKYPEFPRPGMFWLWECAIGTHPKMARPPAAFTLSGHATMYERLRSGYIHLGMGTTVGSPSEAWAAEQGLPYGHIHIHLQFATYVLRTVDGEEITVIRNGHLAALDDPEVVELAKQYGDPYELLQEAWIPPVPGISIPGNYDDYAADPAAWIERYELEGGP
ncbi:MAG TPA: hypothetical protein VHE33_02620, partial [Acidobacteriaceae bacterium]|nr:hypothetical protein [Acidobacteriaceae bacterium]